MSAGPAIAAVDWGTTRLRLWLPSAVARPRCSHSDARTLRNGPKRAVIGTLSNALPLLVATGRRPYLAEEAFAVLRQQLEDRPPPLSQFRPDLAAALYDELPYDYRGEQPPDGRPYYLVPVFTEWEGRLFVRCIPPYIWASQRHAEAPRLTDPQREALGEVVRMADDPTNHVTMELLPGDMQFINNYHVLHGRTAYEDDRRSGRIRHLKRLWLETTVLDSRPPIFANNRTHWSERRTASRLEVR